MTSSDQNKKTSKDRLSLEGPQDRGNEREAVSSLGSSPRGDKDGTSRGFWNRRPVLRFVLVYAVLMGAFATFFYVEFSEGSLFEDYLSLNARWSSAILNAFGYAATPQGTLIIAPKATLDIKRGCDAVLATALFVFGVFAFPSGWRLRVPAMVIGVVALLGLNFVRILSLYLIKLYVPGAFHLMHVHVWQAVFILVPIVSWFAWAVWARKKTFQGSGHVAG